MDVADIIKEYLTEKGFSGLVNSDCECGCELPDLFPCDNAVPTSCEPGYKVNCTPDCEHDPGYEPGAWHIQREKPITPPRKEERCRI